MANVAINPLPELSFCGHIASMANVRTIDLIFLDDLLEMHGGYVLNFSDRTMATFFAEELNIDIDDEAYRRDGTSKAKRLKCFLKTVDASTAIRALNALWDYRAASRARVGPAECVENPQGRLIELIARINGKQTQPTGPVVPAFDRQQFNELLLMFSGLLNLEPNPRGYAFEKFLKAEFDAFNLSAREPFRNRGEQIDGSFVLQNEVYLLEAKWQNNLVGNGELHAFQGKINQKATWTRGVFVSYSGFSEDGLHAFGRGNSVICVDGLDIHEALSRQIPFDHVISQKVRRAAESGLYFARVRDLFPT